MMGKISEVLSERIRKYAGHLKRTRFLSEFQRVAEN